jgi:hypothetical protein
MATLAMVRMRQENLLRDFEWGDGPRSLENCRRKHAGVQAQADIGTRRTNVGDGVWEKLARGEDGMDIHMVTFTMRVEAMGRGARAGVLKDFYRNRTRTPLIIRSLSIFSSDASLFKECRCLGKTQWALYPQFSIAEPKDNRASNLERISLDDSQYSTLAKTALSG